jgi:uncharacterized protein YodC (DUF2158 family)
MQKPFQIGDVVQLKSGGVAMTVVGVRAASIDRDDEVAVMLEPSLAAPPGVTCVWTTRDGRARERLYPPEALARVSARHARKPA